MAGGAPAALPPARIDPVNRLELLNQFKQGLGDLLEQVELELAKPQRDPFTEIDPGRRPHEHDTRRLFVDELLKHLGWRLGLGGNVLEEARLQADTTKFMDYVGVTNEAGSPLLLVEAKAWEKPAIAARRGGQFRSEADLVVAAIRHIRDGKPAEASPISPEWDAYLRQVHGYVRTLKDGYHHALPRAVVVSGEWLVVFAEPVETFLGAVRPDDIFIFTRAEFKGRAEEVFGLLHRAMLTHDAPVPLRPAQLRQFIDFDVVSGAYHGVHVHYERTGSSLFARRPRILLYPALFLVRTDGVIFTVIDNDDYVELEYTRDEAGVDTLLPHLELIRARSASLLAACAAELQGALAARELADFPGFPNAGMDKALVRSLPEANEWLVATGSSEHYLYAEPRERACRFHSWAECGADAALQSAVSVRSIEPRAFFTDTQRHHCAHQLVLDRRHGRCLIQAVDSRTCCQACVFLDHCWTAAERAALPCGQ
jgi:hypothetical protein